MPKKLPEPSTDIYRMLDEAGLTHADLTTTRLPMRKIIEVVRNNIMQQFKQYLEQREAELTSKENKHGKL